MLSNPVVGVVYSITHLFWDCAPIHGHSEETTIYLASSSWKSTMKIKCMGKGIEFTFAEKPFLNEWYSIFGSGAGLQSRLHCVPHSMMNYRADYFVQNMNSVVTITPARRCLKPGWSLLSHLVECPNQVSQASGITKKLRGQHYDRQKTKSSA